MNNNRMISILFVFSLVLSLAVFVSADNPTSLRLGDTTGDGAIDAGDALEVLQYSVGKRDKFTAEGGSLNGNGTPPGPPHFETVAALDSYLKSLTLPPAGFDITQGFYDYLRPDSQNMLIADRYYIVPEVSEEYRLVDIGVYPLQIAFCFENEQGEAIVFSYSTKLQKGNDLISTQTATLKEYKGMTYYVNEAKGEAHLAYEDYVISMETDHPDTVNANRLVELVTFTKVTLPPLKATVQ